MRENNESIKNNLTKIVKYGIPRDVRYIQGFIKKIPQEGEVGYGTVLFVSNDESVILEGVKLSAVGTNTKGDIKLPSQDSDATVALVNNEDAYIVAYSHIDIWNIVVDNSFCVRAVGVNDINDSVDYDEVTETGEVGSVEVGKEIITAVSKNNESEHNTIISPESYSKTITDGTNTSKVEADLEGAGMSASNGTVESAIKVTPTGVEIDGGGINMGAGATEAAVLGNLMVNFLNTFLDSAAGIAGVGGVNPVATNLVALKQQVQTTLSAISKVK